MKVIAATHVEINSVLYIQKNCYNSVIQSVIKKSHSGKFPLIYSFVVCKYEGDSYNAY